MAGEFRVHYVPGTEVDFEAVSTSLSTNEGVRVIAERVPAEDIESVLSRDRVDGIVLEHSLSDDRVVHILNQVDRHQPETISIVLASPEDTDRLSNAITAGATDIILGDPATVPNRLTTRLRDALLAEKTRHGESSRDRNGGPAHDNHPKTANTAAEMSDPTPDTGSDTSVDKEQLIETLVKTMMELYEAESPAACYDIIINTGETILGFDWCTIAMPADDGEHFEIIAISDDAPIEVGERPFRLDEGIAGAVYQTNEPRIDNDVTTTHEAKPTEEVIQAAMTLPIKDRGVFQAVSMSPNAFREDDRRLAELLVASMQSALDRIHQYEELKRQNERLDAFASIISHDLRNPLMLASGALEVYEDEGDPTYAETIREALDRMEVLLEDLLAFARSGKSALSKETVNLAKIAGECWDRIDDDHATLEIESNLQIYADPARTRQLLENLLENAYLHGGDDVTVRIGALANGFFVEDSGPGIPEDRRKDIFEPGHSTAADGSGFGLAIVKEIAEAHGWSINVCDGTVGGARFEFFDGMVR